MKTIKNKILAVVLAGVIMLVQALPVKAVCIQDDSMSSSDVVDVLKSVNENEIECETVQKEDDEYIVETDDQIVTFNENNEIDIIADSDDEKLDMGISFPQNEQVTITKEDDIVVMDNYDDDYFVTTEVFNGGLRNSFVIEETCDEEEFPIQFDLPIGAHLEFSKDEYDENKMDGSLLVMNTNGDIIGAVDIPWAKDANGNAVETYYEINGNTVIQHVKHKKIDNIQYPIVADPLLTFGSCFDSGKWITRNGVVSLSLKPNFLLRMSMIQGSSSMRKYSWSAVVSKFGKSKKWKNTVSMKDQYHCHWYFATFKSEFNLEPSRKVTNWVNMVTSLCNP